jgi:polyhydroxybutyrate depolymerase
MRRRTNLLDSRVRRISRGVLGIFALLVLLPIGAIAAPPCDPCTLDNGTYRAVPPPHWNGRDRLPLLVFLHGYRANGSDMVTDDAVGGPAAKLGFLLVAPDGVGGGWSFTGAPQHGRDDIAFLRAIVADVRQRWPIDEAHIVAGGFSIGGSMVWELACHAPDAFTAFLPFSGGFWDPLPESCPGRPVNLRHVHGRADTTVPLAGRLIGGRWRQGDIFKGFDVWLAGDRCRSEPDRRTQSGDLDCAVWSSCGSARTLQLCLHPRDHMMDAAWLDEGLRWALALPADAHPR